MKEDKINAYVLALKAGGRTYRTIETYQWLLLNLQDHMEKPTIEATAEDLDEYVAAMWDRKLSDVTIATRIQKLETYFGWCVRRGYLDRSPAVHLLKPRPDSLCSEPMERKTFKLLLDSAQAWVDAGKPRDLAIMLFLGDTGCRSGELCELSLDNLYLEERKALVKGKTRKRWVDFTERTARAIQDWLKVRPETGHSHLFLSPKRKGPLTPSGIRQMFHRHAIRAGVTGRHNPHAVRHMIGQVWLDDGANLGLVQMKLGHTDVRTTIMFYGHQGDRDRIKAATKRFSIVSHIR